MEYVMTSLAEAKTIIENYDKSQAIRRQMEGYQCTLRRLNEAAKNKTEFHAVVEFERNTNYGTVVMELDIGILQQTLINKITRCQREIIALGGKV